MVKTAVARLWVAEIKAERKFFYQVPAGLKETVREMLIAAKREELITE